MYGTETVGIAATLRRLHETEHQNGRKAIRPETSTAVTNSRRRETKEHAQSKAVKKILISYVTSHSL
jgi:hypothetical protein